MTQFQRTALLQGAVIVMAVWGCGDGTTDPNNREQEPPPTSTPLSVSSTFPAGNATGVAVGASVWVEFNKSLASSSFDTSTFRISPAVTGDVMISGTRATFNPDELQHETQYTAQISASVQASDGTTLGSTHSWSFTTAPMPVPALVVPLTVGNAWRYSVADTVTVSAWSTGTSRTRFIGERFLYVAEELSLGGKQASRIVFHDFNSTPSTTRPAYAGRSEYLANDTDGIWRWTGTSWRQLTSFTSTTVASGSFLMTGGPRKGADLTMAAVSVTVPAGSFQTLRSTHQSSEYGQYATEHWSVIEREYWANGVGLVASTWINSFDDKDPQAADVWQRGTIELTHHNASSLPTMATESEPNDTTTAAIALALPRSLADGRVHIDDAGALISNRAIGCASTADTACVTPNENGQRILQDWYQFDVASSQSVDIQLIFDTWDEGAREYNDLDLFVFSDIRGLRLVGKSTSVPGESERLQGTISTGRYYVVIQAWRTPGAAVPYWLSLR